MTSRAEPTPEAACALCGTPLADGATRCSTCGYVPTVVARERLMAKASLWLLVGILAAVYLVALVIVAAAR